MACEKEAKAVEKAKEALERVERSLEELSPSHGGEALRKASSEYAEAKKILSECLKRSAS